MKVPQIFDRNMKRLAFLDNAVSVSYSLEINSLWTATFTLPADDDKNAYCQPLNFVEIFDGDERIDLFRIIGEDLERSNGATRFYDCEHVLATLLSDVLFQYHQYGGGGIKTSHPARGAWIEISASHPRQNRWHVAPRKGCVD